MEDQTQIKPNFWSTEVGKKIGYLIHETNSASGIISYYTNKMEDGEAKDRLKEQVKKIIDVVDYIYEYFKQKEGY